VDEQAGGGRALDQVGRGQPLAVGLIDPPSPSSSPTTPSPFRFTAAVLAM
jgi:hypothetical protein